MSLFLFFPSGSIFRPTGLLALCLQPPTKLQPLFYTHRKGAEMRWAEPAVLFVTSQRAVLAVEWSGDTKKSKKKLYFV